MTAKRKSIFTFITSITLAMVLCFGMVLPVFAAPSTEYEGVYEGTEEKPADAAITKKFAMPVGTNIPAATFTFIFTKFSFNAKEADTDKLPHLGTLNVDDNAGTSEVNVTFDANYEVTETNGIKTAVKETQALLENIDWPGGGVYTYSVTEKQPQSPDETNTSRAYTENMTYSQAEYKLSIWVENGAQGPYVKYISAEIIKNDTPGTTGAGKVDPTPGTSNSSADGHSQIIFTNTYLKNNGGKDPKDPKDIVLKISKDVTGAGANQNNYFKFDVTVTKPATVSADPAPKYKAYIMEKVKDGSGNAVIRPVPADSVSKNYGTTLSDAYGNYIEFTSGEEIKEISLKHSQWLAFTDLPVGSAFKVKEYAAVDYTPGCLLSAYKVHPTDSKESVFVNALSIKKKDPNSELTIIDTSVLDFGNGIAYVGDNNDTKAEFINAFSTITPMGIGVDDLPYIALLAAALTVFAGYIVFRMSRKAKNKA